MDKNFIECSGIRFSTDGIALLDEGRVSVFVKRERIEQLFLLHGFQADRPIIQVLLGATVLAIGCLGLSAILRWLIEGGRIPKLTALIVGLIPVGAWIAYEGLKKGFLLMVYEPRKRKLPFSNKVTLEELNEILSMVEEQLGYVIKR